VNPANPAPFTYEREAIMKLAKAASLSLFMSALFLCISASVTAAETLGKSDRNQTLRDDQGREIVFRLHQHSLVHGQFDIPIPSWPIYVVSVYRNGTVVFEGKHLVRTIGKAAHTLTEAQYKGFIQELSKLDLPGPAPRAGVYFARIEVLRDGIIHRSTFTFDDVKAYIELRKSLEDFLRTMQYRCPVDVAGVSKDDAVFYVCADIFELNGLFREKNNGQVR
jgi:hypothetical protein